MNVINPYVFLSNCGEILMDMSQETSEEEGTGLFEEILQQEFPNMNETQIFQALETDHMELVEQQEEDEMMENLTRPIFSPNNYVFHNFFPDPEGTYRLFPILEDPIEKEIVVQTTDAISFQDEKSAPMAYLTPKYEQFSEPTIQKVEPDIDEVKIAAVDIYEAEKLDWKKRETRPEPELTAPMAKKTRTSEIQKLTLEPSMEKFEMLSDEDVHIGLGEAPQVNARKGDVKEEPIIEATTAEVIDVADQSHELTEKPIFQTNQSLVTSIPDKEVTVDKIERVPIKELPTEFVKRIEFMVSENVQEAKIALKPEALGTIHIDLKVENGELIAHFKTEHGFVKEIIEQQFGDLRTALHAQGFTSTKVEVVHQVQEVHQSALSQDMSFEQHSQKERSKQEQTAYYSAEQQQKTASYESVFEDSSFFVKI